MNRFADKAWGKRRSVALFFIDFSALCVCFIFSWMIITGGERVNTAMIAFTSENIVTMLLIMTLLGVYRNI